MGFLDLTSIKVNKSISSTQKLSMFLELFNKLSKIVEKKYPDSSEGFKKFCGAIQNKIQLLELIKNRYGDSASFINECFEEAEKNIRLYATSADPEILKKSHEFSERFHFARKSVILDIESFLVFSRVLLDYIPWMMRPFLKGYVTKEDPATVDFRKFCEWFKKNPNKVIDTTFSKFILEFYEWFMEKLRNPRNELVIHLNRKYTLDKFSSNGSVIRFKHSPTIDGEPSVYELTSPILLFETIHTFLKDFEAHFLRILAN